MILFAFVFKLLYKQLKFFIFAIKFRILQLKFSLLYFDWYFKSFIHRCFLTFLKQDFSKLCV